MVNVPLADLLHAAGAKLEAIRPAWGHEACRELADQLVWADASGKHTHGIVRIPWMERTLPTRSLEVPSFTFDGLTIRGNCQGTLGYLAVPAAVTLALEKSQGRRIEMVLDDAFPTGVLAYYVEPLVSNGFDVVAFATAPSIVGPASTAGVGTNPVLISVGAGVGRVEFDGSLSPWTVGDRLLFETQEGEEEWNPPEVPDKTLGFLLALKALATSIGDGGSGSSFCLMAWPRRKGGEPPVLPNTTAPRRPGEASRQSREQALAARSIKVPEAAWRAISRD